MLQYADRAAAEKAYAFYSSNKKVKYVEYDCSVSAVDYEEQSGGVENGGAEAPAQPAGKYLSWGVESVGLDRLRDELSDNKVSLKETMVAVIDSGVDYTHPFLEAECRPQR